MGVGAEELAEVGGAIDAAPGDGVGEEEALVAGEAVDGGGGLALQRFVVGVVGDGEAAEVGDVFAEGEFAVDVDVVDADAGVEFLDDFVGAGGVAGAVFGGPPVVEVSCGVVLAALVIEAVGHFVADDGADGAVVDGIIGVGLEEGGLQDAGGEDDSVERGVVVGVDGGGRHVPERVIDGPAELGEPEVIVEGGGAEGVEDVGIGLDDEGGEVAPLVGIAELEVDGVELGDGDGAGFGGHPFDGLEAVAVGGAHVVDELLDAFLGGGGKGFGDVEAAEGFAEAAVDLHLGAFPAREHFLRAAHDLLVEVEVFLFKGGGEVGGGGVDESPAEVGFPVVERDGVEERVGGGEELGLADDEGIAVGSVQGAEQGGGVEIGGEGGEFGGGLGIVVGFVVAELDGGAGDLGEFRFDGEDGLGVSGGEVGGIAEEDEHGGDVLLVFGADLDGVLGIGEVVAAFGEAHAALREVEGVARGVLFVDVDRDVEEGVGADFVEVDDGGEEVVARGDVVDAGEFGGEGGDAVVFESGFVHGGGVEVADFAGVGIEGGIGGGVGGFLEVVEDFLEDGAVALADFVEDAPAGFVGGDRVLFEPRAVGVLEEVVAGVEGGVHAGGIDAGFEGARRVGGAQGGGEEGGGDGGGEEGACVHGGLSSQACD